MDELLAGKNLANFVVKHAKKLGLMIIGRSTASVYVRTEEGYRVRISDHRGKRKQGYESQICFPGGARPEDVVERMRRLAT